MSNLGQSAIDGIPSRRRTVSDDMENHQLKKQLKSATTAEERRLAASERQKLIDKRQKIDRKRKEYLESTESQFTVEKHTATKVELSAKRRKKTAEQTVSAPREIKTKTSAEPSREDFFDEEEFEDEVIIPSRENYHSVHETISPAHEAFSAPHETSIPTYETATSPHETTIEPDDPEYENPAILNALRRQELIRNGLSPERGFYKEEGGIEIGVPTDDEKNESPKKLKNPLSKKKKIAIVVVSVLVVFIGGIAIWGQSLLSKITGGNADLFSLITSAFSQDVDLKKGKNDRANVLVFGTSGYDMNGSGHDGYQLTDSIMIVSLDQSTKDVAMVSIPRDFYVGNTCTNTGKINEVFHCSSQNGSDENAGKDALASTVENITGIDTQYFVHVDWGALVQVVDSIGGITVTLDEDIDDTWTNTHIKAGVATNLNGEQALGLARARHGTERGDFSRGNSQQKILIALQQKLLGGGVSIAEATSLLNTLGDNVRTDFNSNELITIFHLAASMRTADLRQVPLITDDFAYVKNASMNVDGTEVSFVIPTLGSGDFSAIKKYIARSFSADPAVREEANIIVLNGAGVSGLASDEKETLESVGYDVINIGDAPDGIYPEKFYLYDLTNKKPATKAALEKRYSVTAKTADLLPNDIVTNNADFVLIIGERPDLNGVEKAEQSL